jgi:hypothetical protein
MTALAAARKVTRYDGSPATFVHHVGGVAATTKLYYGALVVRNSTGYFAPATTATGLIPVGVCVGDKEKNPVDVDNTAGAAGALEAHACSGTFLMKNAGDITIAEIGDLAYADDDQTVTAVSTGRSAVGRIVQVQADGVFIQVGPLSW